jgi:hypothetical protein
MKSLVWKLCLAAIFLWLTSFSKISVAVAADDNPAEPSDRLQQLERRVNELADRQEQILRRLNTPRRPMAQWGLPQQRPMPPNLGNARPLPGAGMPAPAWARGHEGLRGLIGLIIIAGIICNILLAVWIFTDIRKRGEGSGIFIALALVAGIPTAIIYALVRIGDKKVPA